MDVTELPEERFDEGSVVMADAFLDDPGWKDVGPDDPAKRHAIAACSRQLVPSNGAERAAEFLLQWIQS